LLVHRVIRGRFNLMFIIALFEEKIKTNYKKSRGER